MNEGERKEERKEEKGAGEGRKGWNRGRMVVEKRKRERGTKKQEEIVETRAR